MNEPIRALIDRITEYLENGGLFNPEMMDHAKVRDLILEIRTQIALVPEVVPIMQTRHGLQGNCLAACLASIFRLRIEEIPDLATPEIIAASGEQSKALRRWLRTMGLTYIEIDLEQQFAWTNQCIPEAPCLLSVKSITPEVAAKGYGHFVVGVVRQDAEAVRIEVIHDPNGMQKRYTATAVGYFVTRFPQHFTHE